MDVYVKLFSCDFSIDELRIKNGYQTCLTLADQTIFNIP